MENPETVVSTPLKNISQNGNLSPNRGENKKYLKPPTSNLFDVRLLLSTGFTGAGKGSLAGTCWVFCAFSMEKAVARDIPEQRGDGH